MQQVVDDLIKPLLDPLGPKLGSVHPLKPQAALNRRLSLHSADGVKVQGVALSESAGRLSALMGQRSVVASLLVCEASVGPVTLRVDQLKHRCQRRGSFPLIGRSARGSIR